MVDYCRMNTSATVRPIHTGRSGLCKDVLTGRGLVPYVAEGETSMLLRVIQVYNDILITVRVYNSDITAYRGQRTGIY